MNTKQRIDHILDKAGVPSRSRKSELARICGISYESVRKWFTGDTAKIDADNLEKIARHFRVTLDWLQMGKGDSGEQQPGTDNQVKLIKKADIGTYLSGESVKSKLLPRELSAIKEYRRGSERTFSYIEDVASIQSLIIPGETIVMVDPDAGIAATGRGRHYLVKINDRYLIGYIEETASGIMLNFDNQSPGWDAIAITPSDCVGRVLSAFERNWKNNQ
jgi:transcriptional regulator with XRE-family HTH domain